VTRKLWTDVERGILRHWYGRRPTSWIAARFKRSVRSVWMQARLLGVARRNARRGERWESTMRRLKRVGWSDAMAGDAGEFMMRMRNAAMNAVSEDDIRDIFQELVRKAKKGDLQAMRMLFGYVLPTQEVLLLPNDGPKGTGRPRGYAGRVAAAIERRNGE
jgi:hypothetical protein